MTTADKLRGLMQGATRGPWYDDGWRVYGHTDDTDKRNGPLIFEYKHFGCPSPKDSTTIVASVNLLPALAAVVEAGNAAVAKLRTLHYGEPVGRDDAKVVWDLKEALSALDAAVAREVG